MLGRKERVRETTHGLARVRKSVGIRVVVSAHDALVNSRANTRPCTKERRSDAWGFACGLSDAAAATRAEL